MTPNGSPIQYPVVQFGEDSYEVKFSMLSQYVLDEEGVDPRQLPEIMRSPRPGKVALIFKLFAAGVAHHFVEARQPIPTGAEWAARCESAGVTFKQIIEAVNSAIKKAPSPAEAGQPVPAEAPAVN